MVLPAWPSPSTMRSSLPGHAWWMRQGASRGLLTSSRPWMRHPGMPASRPAFRTISSGASQELFRQQCVTCREKPSRNAGSSYRLFVQPSEESPTSASSHRHRCGTCLDDDGSEQIGAGHETPAAAGQDHLHLLNPMEGLGAARNLDCPAGWCRREVGARTDVVRGEYIHQDRWVERLVLVAVSPTVGTHAVRLEVLALQGPNEGQQRVRSGADVSDGVSVLTDLQRLAAMLEGVEQHHLPADEHPRHPLGLRGQDEEFLPELIDGRAQPRQSDDRGHA